MGIACPVAKWAIHWGAVEGPLKRARGATSCWEWWVFVRGRKAGFVSSEDDGWKKRSRFSDQNNLPHSGPGLEAPLPFEVYAIMVLHVEEMVGVLRVDRAVTSAKLQ